MMQQYVEIKEEMLEALRHIVPLFTSPQQLTGMTDSAFSEWTGVCDVIEKQLSEDLIRVAVVGAIKSGKSTFINSLLGDDYLKRGAGVVTSIVTRIRHGRVPKATLFLKSWEQINTDIANALVLLPNFNPSDNHGRFDIRRDEDRSALATALEGLNPELMITRDARNANAVLLGSYLKGYDRVKSLISTEPGVKVYEKGDMDAHRAFVSEDARAVFLSDIELEINSPLVNKQIEIADCQGSDSSNPLHLAMIQDYLNLTHLIVYVISSRTGVRRADIRFLSMIKKMGILDNIIFVINCDLSEHGSLEDLSSLIRRTTEELALLRPDPKVFAFSALLKLFEEIKSRISEKDRLRLSQWESEKQMTAYCHDNVERFFSTFSLKTTVERQAVLFGNLLERLERIVGGLIHWLEVNRKLVSRDTESASQIGAKIETYQKRISHIRRLMDTTLEGALNRIKKRMKRDVDHFFGSKAEGAIASVLNTIRSYDPAMGDYASALSDQGFNATIYQVFQDFKQSIDTFMAESVTPQILGYLREKEAAFITELASMVEPYDVMIQDAVTEFSRSMSEIGIPPMAVGSGRLDFPDVQTVKQQTGITFPPAVLTLHYSVSIKTEAVVRLGVYSAMTFIRKILKRPPREEQKKEIRALSDGLRRMRHEMEDALLSHFIDYRENIKFQYMIKLADSLSAAVRETLLNRFQSYVDSLLNMLSLIDSKQLDEAHASSVLADMTRRTEQIEAQLSRIRNKMGLHDN